jgi:hypothetical protein
MSRLDDLPPDQRATLSLLLRRHKSYAEVATMLDIQERAVHDRAHAALGVLAARQARELSAERREEVGDYLLGQRSGVAERLATRTFLEGSPEARAWASALAAELEPLAGEPLPEIPARSSATAKAPSTPSAGEERARATPRSRSASPSSRRGGALLLGAIVVIVIVVVVLVSSGGGSASKSSTSAASETGTASTGTTSTAGTSSTSAKGTQTAKAKEDKRITLSSPEASSKSAGVAEVLSEGDQYAFYLAAQHLPASKGFFYAVWLYNSPSSFEALSRAPSVGSNGNLQGGALLPKDAGKYDTMLLTKETASRPTSPGTIVLRGSFALH